MKLWADLVAATHTDDPLQGAANRIALFVGTSQPFYPLGLVWVMGEGAWASAIAWVTTPVFLAVPFVGRVLPGLARFLVALAGTFVTTMVALRLGVASWVEAYHLPVLLVALLLFRRGEGLAQALSLALPVVGFALVHGLGPSPAVVEGADKLQWLHGVGALILSAYVIYEARSARKRGVATSRQASV